MTHSDMQQGSFKFWTQFIHTKDMTHSYTRHMWDTTHLYVGHDALIDRTRRIHKRDMSYSYMEHDSLICETWLIHTWDRCMHIWNMTHSYAGHVPFIRGTWLILWCHLTLAWSMTLSWHSRVSCDSFLLRCCVTPLHFTVSYHPFL